MNIQFPDNINIETFLSEYWQRKPLLIPKAFKADFFSLQADELAGLATDPELESRLVLEQGKKPWSLRHGPFSEADFADLPETHWTLLVQDVDKFVPEAHSLLQSFSFIPDWRLDDIMVSYAADKGSVGPHTDSYDVFLIQVNGKRRWRIGATEDLHAGLLKDTDLSILQQFTTQDEWLLEPGDMLYLPPNLPHWGIADGECMTCSVGFRSPTKQDMLDDWTQSILEQGLAAGMYEDPPLSQQQSSAEINTSAFDQAEQILNKFTLSAADQRRWFGRLVTQSKQHLQLPIPEQLTTNEQLAASLDAGEILIRHPFTRMAFAEVNNNEVSLFANGECFDLPLKYRSLVTLIAEAEEITADHIRDYRSDHHCLSLLAALINSGNYSFDD